MIKPEETSISGRWVVEGGIITGDQNCVRIRELTTQFLQKLGHDISGWDTLYVDPTDKRLWELIHPESELHGGGPPSLVWIPSERAQVKYRDVLLQKK